MTATAWHVGPDMVAAFCEACGQPVVKIKECAACGHLAVVHDWSAKGRGKCLSGAGLAHCECVVFAEVSGVPPLSSSGETGPAPDVGEAPVLGPGVSR